MVILFRTRNAGVRVLRMYIYYLSAVSVVVVHMS